LRVSDHKICDLVTNLAYLIVSFTYDAFTVSNVENQNAKHATLRALPSGGI